MASKEIPPNCGLSQKSTYVNAIELYVYKKKSSSFVIIKTLSGDTQYWDDR